MAGYSLCLWDFSEIIWSFLVRIDNYIPVSAYGTGSKVAVRLCLTDETILIPACKGVDKNFRGSISGTVEYILVSARGTEEYIPSLQI
jgi:hypothetical protein